MNPLRCVVALLLSSGLVSARAQTYVTPKLGGAQTAADMVHIDIHYDAEANQMSARVDDSFGIPQLRPLEPGFAFEPHAAYSVLSGKAYNAQYGWNAGGFFTIPAGAAIWIEQLDSSPGLEVFDGWGKSGSYAPILGTDHSPRLWRWSGVMTHNTYAVAAPVTDRFYAEYHIYFGDAETGSREGLLDLDDARVRLEWTATPADEPWRLGAADTTSGAPLQLVNAAAFVTESEFVRGLRPTEAGFFDCLLPMLAVPATLENGGPALSHAALGSCLEVQVVSLTGPPNSHLSVWETEAAQPRFTVDTGERAGAHRIPVSQNHALPGTDPYGCTQGWRLTVDRPGLYTLGFRLVDSSTNGPAGSPLHTPSDIYQIYLQAGVTMAWAEPQSQALTVTFGGQPGWQFTLESRPLLPPNALWQTVAGPLAGASCLQRLSAPMTAEPQQFYRLAAHPEWQ